MRRRLYTAERGLQLSTTNPEQTVELVHLIPRNLAVRLSAVKNHSLLSHVYEFNGTIRNLGSSTVIACYRSSRTAIQWLYSTRGTAAYNICKTGDKWSSSYSPFLAILLPATQPLNITIRSKYACYVLRVWLVRIIAYF